MSASMPRFTLHLLFVAAAILASVPAASAQANPSTQSPDRPSSLAVSLRMPDGSPLDTPAMVNLYTFSGTPAGIGVFRSGTAEFTNLAPASYTLDIIAAGYKHVTENVQIFTAGEHQQLSIALTPESAITLASPSSATPILAPKAQKEVTIALKNLRATKPENARKHLEKASQLAPSHPDIIYLWGMYYAQVSDFASAKAYWEKAVQIWPHHVYSLAALAQLALQKPDYPAATAYLLRASEGAPSSWRYQEQLSEIYLNQQQYENAQKYAERALQLGKEHAAGAHFLLAQIYLQRKNREAALKQLDTFVATQPSGPRALEAHKLLDSLRKPDPPMPAIANASLQLGNPDSNAKSSPSNPITVDLMPPPRWMPPDVDDSMPVVESTAGCPLQMIQDESGKRVSEFVDAVNRIAATESLDSEVVDRSGIAMKRNSVRFSYVASVEQVRPGMYVMEEYRNGMMDLEAFPDRVATLGLTALVMVFHPNYRDDYEVTCEGLSRWHGGLAWQVHFRQKANRPARLRSYRVNTRSYPIALRGRAWISAQTFQIENLET